LSPRITRVIAFFDGQNLFHAARSAFGYTYPNYNPKRLAATLKGLRSKSRVIKPCSSESTKT